MENLYIRPNKDKQQPHLKMMQSNIYTSVRVRRQIRKFTEIKKPDVFPDLEYLDDMEPEDLTTEELELRIMNLQRSIREESDDSEDEDYCAEYGECDIQKEEVQKRLMKCQPCPLNKRERQMLVFGMESEQEKIAKFNAKLNYLEEIKNQLTDKEIMTIIDNAPPIWAACEVIPQYYTDEDGDAYVQSRFKYWLKFLCVPITEFYLERNTAVFALTVDTRRCMRRIQAQIYEKGFRPLSIYFIAPDGKKIHAGLYRHVSNDDTHIKAKDPEFINRLFDNLELLYKPTKEYGIYFNRSIHRNMPDNSQLAA